MTELDGFLVPVGLFRHPNRVRICQGADLFTVPSRSLSRTMSPARALRPCCRVNSFPIRILEAFQDPCSFFPPGQDRILPFLSRTGLTFLNSFPPAFDDE